MSLRLTEMLAVPVMPRHDPLPDDYYYAGIESSTVFIPQGDVDIDGHPYLNDEDEQIDPAIRDSLNLR